MRIPTLKNLIKKIFNLRKWLLFKKVEKSTLVCHERLYNLYDLCNEMEKKGIPGSFVECGVWKGGASAVMAHIADRWKSDRQIWLFDSFEGLPKPKEIDGQEAKKIFEENKLIASVEDIEDLFFKKFNFDKNNIHIIKGWFNESLPKHKEKIGQISILRLDGDWYESTKTCLKNLFDNVVKSGYVIIDDYGCWPGCKKAVDEFLFERDIKADLIRIDRSGYYFKKF